jgi:hypothetical protein
MARPITPLVLEARQKLLARIAQGGYRPGDRFPSNRALAARLGVCYQTADRLVRELCAEGLLERRAGSGTYLPGEAARQTGAVLLFDQRARKPGSFGAFLLARLEERLRRERIPWRVSWRSELPGPSGYPVLWEQPALVEQLAGRQGSGLILTDEPPAGQAARFLDCVTIDEYCGGAAAGELLRERLGLATKDVRGLALISGPAGDKRSRERVRGFCSVLRAREICAGGWGYEDGLAVAGEALRLGRRGIFCCNDRLAEAVIRHARQHALACPPLVGFDDAPVAEQLNLTTIANPWDELVRAASALIKARLAGDRSGASRRIFTPYPVRREGQAAP